MFSTIGIIIDIAIVLALVICGIIGYKKGFLHTILSLFSWIVCVAVAVLVAKHVAGWINGIYDLSSLIGSKIEGALIKSNEFFSLAVNSEIFAGDANNILTQASNAGVEGFIYQLIKLVFTHASVNMTSEQTIASFVGSSLGHICMIIIAGILVFIVLMIAVALLRKLFDKISETKILGGLNKILGLVLGLVRAGVIIIVINCALVGLSLIPTANKIITPIIQDNTYVEKFIYNKTDEITGKYLIEGEMLQEWISSLWEAREK